MRTQNIKWIFLLFLTLPFKIFGQVNLQTGSIAVSIPIFDCKDEKNNLSTSIQLFYSGGNGIKVNEVASDVGLGWKLNVGGMIIRKQIGEPDDQKRTNGFNYTPWQDYQDQVSGWTYPDDNNIYTLKDLCKKVYGDGYLYTAVNPETSIPSSLAYVPQYEKLPNGVRLSSERQFKAPLDILADKEADIFSFSFNGRSGSFIFGKDGTIRSLEDSKLKIEGTFSDLSSLHIRTKLSAFIITDEMGIKYKFQDYNLNELCYYKKSKTYNYDVYGNFAGMATSPEYFDGDFNGYNSHIFNYEGIPLDEYIIDKWYLSEIVNPLTNQKIIFSYDNYNVDYIVDKNISYTPFDENQYGSLSIINQRSIGTDKRIHEILFPNQDSILFNYELAERIDLPGSNSIKEIIKYSKDQVSKFSFNYGYFFKNEIKDFAYSFTENDKLFTRLCLKSISRSGVTTKEPPYKFDYFLGSTNDDYVPPRLSFSRDWWGYYNGRGLYYEPYLTSLPKISDLVNLVKNPIPLRIPNGIFKNGMLQKVTYPAGGSLEYFIGYNFTNNTDGGGNIIGSGGGRVEKIIQFDGLNHANDLTREFRYIKEDGTNSHWGDEIPKFHYTEYFRQYKSPVQVEAGTNATEYALFNLGNIASLFINNVSFKDAVAFMADANFAYVMQKFKTYLVSLALHYIGYIFSPNYQEYSKETFLYTPINYQNPLPNQFSRVEVLDNLGAGGYNGKTVYEFTSPTLYPIEFGQNAYSFPYSAKQRCFSSAYGLPLKITYLNSINSKVKEVENVYVLNKSFLGQNFASQNAMVLKSFNARFNDNICSPANIPSDALIRDTYYPIAGRIYLERTIERDYSVSGAEITASKIYSYNQNNLQPNSISSTNSKGESIEQKFYYPQDYSSTGIFANLINSNIINLPIASETWVNKPNGQRQLVNATATDYAIISGGNIKPVKSYNLEAIAPVPENILQPFNTGSAIRDANFIKEQQQYVYDNSGNLVQTISKGRSSSVLYDYHESVITMNIVNAIPNGFAYTSFEAENKGNWHYNDEGIQQQFSITGSYCYQLSANNNISSNIFIAKPSIISLWANNSSILVDGAFSPSKVINGIGGWKYYEFEISAGTSTHNITGDALIDEVRLYPKDSRMTTYTYNSLKNKTSECDPNNRIKYYEYDGLGRLLIERDQNGNVLKTYEYHFKNN